MIKSKLFGLNQIQSYFCHTVFNSSTADASHCVCLLQKVIKEHQPNNNKHCDELNNT